MRIRKKSARLPINDPPKNYELLTEAQAAEKKNDAREHFENLNEQLGKRTYPENMDRWWGKKAESMSQRVDANTVAVVRSTADRIHDLLHHFANPGATWDDCGKGEAWLESVKHDLALLASCVEDRIQEVTTRAPQDFG